MKSAGVNWVHPGGIEGHFGLGRMRILKTWDLYVSAFSRTCSRVREGRVTLFPHWGHRSSQ